MEEGDDAKNVSKFSSILVDTIQEAKDKICQIEDILCTQLYSVFQSKSEEESWKEKEKDLLLQIEKLQHQNQQFCKANQFLQLENQKALAQLNETRSLLQAKQDKIDELECEVRKHSKKFDEGLELQSKLLQMVYANASTIVADEKQLKDFEEKTDQLFAKVKKLEKRIEELEVELGRKTQEVADKEKIAQDLSRRVESLYKEREEATTLHEKEKKELVRKSEVLEYSVCALQKKSRNKTGQHEEGKCVQTQLLLQEIELQGAQSKDGSGPFLHQQHLTNSLASCKIKRVKIEYEVKDGVEGSQAAKSIPLSSFRSPSSSHKAKSVPVISRKRPASRWVDTRCRGDDFLDIPPENLRAIANKATNEKDAHTDSTDDETKDINAPNVGNHQLMQPSMAAQKEFKYVEPVRKKGERENLKGVECKQCKKFYDALLPNQGEHNLRCEHHEASV